MLVYLRRSWRAFILIFGDVLDNLRRSLQSAYINIEARLANPGAIEHINNFSKNSLDGIHETFRLMFREMKEGSKSGQGIQPIRLHNVKEDVKRKLSSTNPGSDNVQGKRLRHVLCSFKFWWYDFNPRN